MKLEVGMFVRTNLGIAKYLGKGTCENPFTRKIEETDIYEFDKLDEELWSGDVPNWVFECDIEDIVLKASHNIIDLLQVGDIIEFKELRTHLTNESGTKFYGNYVVSIFNEEELKVAKEEIEGKHMKLLSVLTKEQMEAMQYKVV